MSSRWTPRPVIALALTVLLLVGFAAGTAAARDVTKNWGIGLDTGLMKLTEGYWDYSNLDQFVSLNVTRGLSSRWDLQFTYKYGYVRPGIEATGEDAGWTTSSGAGFYNVISQPTIKLMHRFAPDSRFCPKLGAGLGWTSWKVLDLRYEDVGLMPSGDPAQGYDLSGNLVPLEGKDFTVAIEAGADAFLTTNLALNLGARYHLTPGNEIDNIGTSSYWGDSHVDANTASVEGYLGLTWWFGSRDSDKDGVVDERDACPEVAEDLDGFNDLDGCPDPDNDGDRIPDDRDECPLEPEDFDGFQDADGCPEPDNDGDGIVDARDACPDEPEDEDGFTDLDGCPDPDNDGDGVLDANDRCPGTAAGAAVDDFGCPKAAEIKANLVLEGVKFLSGSAQLTPESIAVLTEVAESLQAWPDVRIEIRGHTDSTGAAETNRDLSQRRAQSVLDTLVHMGVDPERLTAIGYGEDYPLADNDTAEGRRINRRVEIHKID